MNISQKDRDSLRAKQQMLMPSFNIGNIVEHKIQDPAKYKAISREEQGLSKEAQPDLPKLNYKSKYLKEENNCDSNTPVILSAQSNVDMETKVDAEATASTICGRINESKSDSWLNMDIIEFEKLEWMSERADKAYLEKIQATTHFDREGRAIAPENETGIDRDNQAHDIESLVKLLDSTFQPQVTYSLNVISKIASRATRGEYDTVFDENIHQILIEECLLRVRRHVDSNNETICLAALKCMCSLICNTQVDELFLDRMCTLKSEECDATMWLNINQGDFDIELKDDDCVRIDAILTLLTRTDLLTRLAYLFKTKVDVTNWRAYQDYILDLLIRIARHSGASCWMLSSFGFPDLLIKDCLPHSVLNGNEISQRLALRTIKLFRILSVAALELKSLVEDDDCLKIKLPEAIERYILDYYHICNPSTANTNLIFKINIETLRLMRVLTSLENFSKLMFKILTMDQALLVANLRAIVKLDVAEQIRSKSSLDWQYAASLFDLLGTMMNYEKYNLKSHMIESHWTTFVAPVIHKWWKGLVSCHLVPHVDVSIAIASATQHFDRCTDDSRGNSIYSLLLGASEDEASNSTATYYRKLMREATCHSCLSAVLETNGRLRDPKMLPSYGFLDLNTSNESRSNINKYAGDYTPFILLKALVDFMQRNHHANRSTFNDHDNYRDLILYMNEISGYFKKSINYELAIQESFMAQQEISIISKSLIMLVEKFIANYAPETATQPDDKHSGSFSDILLATVAIIGLMNISSTHMASLKDMLMEKIILGRVFHRKLTSECYKSKRKEEFGSKFDIFAHDDSLASLKLTLKKDDELILKPVYMNCEQYGRFWIFQPIIKYYKSQLRDDNQSDTMSLRVDGKWFAENMFEGTTENQREMCNDSDVIAAILRLNTFLMECSPAFFEAAVKPNIEQLVCLVGVMFLETDLFVNKSISEALKKNLLIMFADCTRSCELFRDASQTLETLNLTVADFFNKLIKQYEASSYGDLNFSNYLLLFISPKCDSLFKKKLFSEKLETCLNQMRIHHDSVWLPQAFFDVSLETDPEIRSLIELAGPYLVETNFLKSYRTKCLTFWKGASLSDK